MASIISSGTTSGTALNMTADTSGQLQLATGASATTAVTIDTSQNVGIGTTSPAVKLDINGQTIIRNQLNIFTGYALALNDSTNVNTYYLQNASSNLQFIYNSTERMRIDSSGNVLIGTTSTAPRDFTSGSGVALVPSAAYEYATANSVVSFMNYTGSASGAGTFITFRQQGAARGSISTNGSTTAYNTSSDYRLKENIAPMTGALDIVQTLKPSTYTWKETGVNSQGFIAHELQAVVPDCVTGEKDAVDAEGKPVYQGVDTSFLVATLTAAIQEQQTIINDLKARVIALESK